MADEEKRLSATELRAQQVERERAEQSARAAKAESARQEQAERERREVEAVVSGLRNSWYGTVVNAAKRTDVRFVVLAEVIRDQSMNALLEPLTELIGKDGYHAEVTRTYQPPSGHSRGEDAEVNDGKCKGILPAKVPKIGWGGELGWYVVRW